MKLYGVRFGINFKYADVADFAFMYYLAEIEGKFVLFDVGFDDVKLAQNMGIDLMPVGHEIDVVFGGMPAIDTIIITHSHWDHLDSIWRYEGSQIYMPALAYENAMQESPERVKMFLRRAYANHQVHLISEPETLMGRFLFEVVSGHSKDSSVVSFKEKDLTYCITGDECFSCDYLRTNTPLTDGYSIENSKHFTKKAYSNGWIPLPSHDNAVMNQYEKISDNIVRII